ncbi:MAG: hypothetical protein KDD64_03925 [Bdellovibrionales bacterium]|nr:hypothetical protein [Bdellovibrionales bacterium]
MSFSERLEGAGAFCERVISGESIWSLFAPTVIGISLTAGALGVNAAANALSCDSQAIHEPSLVERLKGLSDERRESALATLLPHEIEEVICSELRAGPSHSYMWHDSFGLIERGLATNESVRDALESRIAQRGLTVDSMFDLEPEPGSENAEKPFTLVLFASLNSDE